MRGLTTACCGDRRLNRIIAILDSDKSYRKRDLGTPFDFIINQAELLVWHSKLTGFPEGGAPISDALILLHTDCLAVQTNAFFATLREKRCGRYAMTHKGDVEFCLKQLEKIKIQAARLTGPIPIHWHFGIIDTEKAIHLKAGSGIKEAIACIIWPFDVPTFFAKHIEVAPHESLHTNHMNVAKQRYRCVRLVKPLLPDVRELV